MAQITSRQTVAVTDKSQGLSINDAMYSAERNLTPWFAVEWATSTAAGSVDAEWIDVRGSTLTTWFFAPVGTFSGSVQATLDGGKTWADVLAEVGANPLTEAIKFARFRGAFMYMRFKTTAQSANVVVSTSVVGGA